MDPRFSSGPTKFASSTRQLNNLRFHQAKKYVQKSLVFLYKLHKYTILYVKDSIYKVFYKKLKRYTVVPSLEGAGNSCRGMQR